jgi:hypothetical protein
MKGDPAEAAPKAIPSVARDASYLTRSAVGQKRRFGDVHVTSALAPKADIHRKGRHVSKVP